MTLTDEQLTWLRTELGAAPATEVLQAKYDRLGDIALVAVEVWKERRTTLIASPLKASVSGVASVDNSANIGAITQRIAALEASGVDGTDEGTPAVTRVQLAPRFGR